MKSWKKDLGEARKNHIKLEKKFTVLTDSISRDTKTGMVKAIFSKQEVFKTASTPKSLVKKQARKVSQFKSIH